MWNVLRNHIREYWTLTSRVSGGKMFFCGLLKWYYLESRGQRFQTFPFLFLYSEKTIIKMKNINRVDKNLFSQPSSKSHGKAVMMPLSAYSPASSSCELTSPKTFSELSSHYAGKQANYFKANKDEKKKIEKRRWSPLTRKLNPGSGKSMFLILAKEKIEHLKDCLFVWNRVLRFPNRQQAVKKFQCTAKRMKLKTKY